MENNIEYKIIEDITHGPLKSAYVGGAPFDKAKEALERRGYRIISLEEMARLRIQEGKGAEISLKGNWVREGLIYAKKGEVFLTKNSPIMELPVEATECHRNGRDFDDLAKIDRMTCEDGRSPLSRAHANSCKVGCADLEIPMSKMDKWKLISYAFGSQAKDYVDFLKESLIDPPIINSLWYMPDIHTFAVQAWLTGLNKSKYGSISGADDWAMGRYLSCGYRSRGVKEE